MVVLHPNNEQFNTLESYRNNASMLSFVIDGSGRYIVGVEVLSDPNFAEIQNQLLELEQIEYTPIEQ